MALTIRPMTAQDTATVLALFRQCHPGWPERVAEFYTENKTFVAIENKTVVGFTVLGLMDGQAIGYDTCVHPAYQGRGIGRRLHDHKVQVAREVGAQHFVGATWETNEPMKRILTHSGFVLAAPLPPDHFPDGSGHSYVRALTDAGH